jgi:hypothetical protein
MSYDIGYRRPPKGRPFQKGESGNPNGRPKMQVTPIQRYVLKALATKITVGEKGEKMTAREAIVRLRMQAAISGDPNAVRDLMLLEKREIRAHSNGPKGIIIEYVDPDPKMRGEL